MNYVEHWNITNLQFSSHLSDCCLPVFPYLLFHFIVSVRHIHTVKLNRVSCISYIWLPTFKLPAPLIYMPRWHTLPLCDEYLQASHSHYLRNEQLCAVPLSACYQGAAIFLSGLLMSYFQNGWHTLSHMYLKRVSMTYLCHNCLLLSFEFLEQNCSYY